MTRKHLGFQWPRGGAEGSRGSREPERNHAPCRVVPVRDDMQDEQDLDAPDSEMPGSL